MFFLAGTWKAAAFAGDLLNAYGLVVAGGLRAAVNAVKKEERAARRQRAIMRDLGTVRDVGTRRAAARPVDYTGAAYDAQIKAAERAHGRYI